VVSKGSGKITGSPVYHFFVGWLGLSFACGDRISIFNFFLLFKHVLCTRHKISEESHSIIFGDDTSVRAMLVNWNAIGGGRDGAGNRPNRMGFSVVSFCSSDPARCGWLR